MILACNSGIRWLDDDRASRVKAPPLRMCRRDAVSFVCYLETHAWGPFGPEEWDDLLVEYALKDKSHHRVFVLRLRTSGIPCRTSKGRGSFLRYGSALPRRSCPGGAQCRANADWVIC